MMYTMLDFAINIGLVLGKIFRISLFSLIPMLIVMKIGGVGITKRLIAGWFVVVVVLAIADVVIFHDYYMACALERMACA